MEGISFGNTVLEPSETTRLLEALRAGVINMAEFRDFCHKRSGVKMVDFSTLTLSQIEQFQAIYAKRQFSNDGIVVLNRELKIRLLNTIRIGFINLHRDFPELIKAYKAIRTDWSAITSDELRFVVKLRRTMPQIC